MSNPIKVVQIRKTSSEYEGVCTVTNFNELEKSVSSSNFYSGQNDESVWCIEIFKGGYDTIHWKYVSVRFWLLEDYELDYVDKLIHLRVVASVIDKDGEKYSTKSARFEEEGCAIIRDFLLKADLLYDRLNSRGEFRFAFHIFSVAGLEMSNYQKSQLQILGKVLDDGKYADFKLVIKGKEFNVHRAILAARSPVFEAMFDSQMRENNEGKVDIVDIEAKVMEKLLRFVYVGKVENFEDLAGKVLVAAEKYQIDELKQLCEDVLVEQLNLANVYTTLCFADENNAQNLKKRTMEFFQHNIKELYADVNFKALIFSLAEHLKADIICVLAKSLQEQA